MKSLMTILLFPLLLLNSGFSQRFATFASLEARPAFVKPHLSGPYTKIPFELVHGLLFVEADLEGKPGHFILDTGAPTLIINSKNQGRGTEEMVTITSDDYHAQSVNVEQFSWAGIEKNDIEGLVMDISHLEENYQRKLAGIIGFQIFSDREILIDTRNKLIYLSNEKGDPFEGFGAPDQVIPFSVQGHLPVLELNIGDRSFQFAFDSGCSINLFDKAFLESEPTISYREIRRQKISGFAPEAMEAAVIEVEDVSVAGPGTTMEFMATDLSHLKATELNIQGLLGYPFVADKVFSISYQKKTITFWDTDQKVVNLIP